MKTPYVVVECDNCGLHVQVPGWSVSAGIDREGQAVANVTAICPDCGEVTTVQLSG